MRDMKKAITTDGAPNAPAFLSQAIESNGMIFVSGQIHNLPDGTLVEGTTEEKLALVMGNIEEILSTAGTTFADIVKATIYVTDMAQMPDINKLYPAYFSEPFPAREAVCVKELPLGATIEISVIAMTV
jgi:2-iminobutanoate/2-iminopropanoate deaminase